ncbi:MAG: IPT/TIG domain-containing protein [Verrucomicrobia bacterium]|nr:IPT/TIG domain-containing protein [Cytophagales bacterium]
MVSHFKKIKTSFYPVLFALAFLITNLTGCQKSEEVQAPNQQISINKSSAMAGDTLILTGTDFKSSKTRNIVKFGDKEAEVISVGDTQLKVIVPEDAVSGKISVTSDGVTSLSVPPITLVKVFVSGYELVPNSTIKGIAKCWGCNIETLTNGRSSAGTNAIKIIKNSNNRLGYDVYVAGWEYDLSGNCIAKYWKNGVPVNLSNSTYAEATSIQIIGNDVYVAGRETGLNGKSFALYWKNGVPVILPKDNIQNGAYAHSIFVVGNDIYVSGTESYFDGEWHRTAKYWKNGVSVTLPKIHNLNNSDANSIFVVNNDVYVGGNEESYDYYYNYYSVAKYWKNGTAINITKTIESNFAKNNSMFVVGNDVYVAGWQDEKNGYRGPVYWKNGVRVKLSGNSEVEEASSIFVNGNNVYVAGYEQSKANPYYPIAKYWRNGISVYLTDGSKYSGTTDIALITQ